MSSLRDATMPFFSGEGMMAGEDMIMARQGELKRLHVIQKVLEGIRERTSGTKLESIDGVKIWHEDQSWILIRPSGTEPAFRLFAEAKNKDRMDQLISHYRQIVEDLVKR
jgi:phosphomannomutase